MSMIDALKDAGDNWLIVGDESWNTVKQRKYTQAMANTMPDVAANDSSFKLWAANELTQKPAPIDWLIKGYIERGSLNLLFGKPGAGKSLFALEWGFCVASDISWNGHCSQKSDVVIIAGEGFRGYSRRLRALELKYEATAPENLFISENPAQLLDKSNALLVAGAIESHCCSPGLIIIDTLHRNMAGDENSAKDIGEFISNLDKYLKSTGAAVLVVHHSGHGTTDRSRGSSSIRAAMDAEFSVTKTKGSIDLKCHKSKDFEPPEPTEYKLQTMDLDWLDDDTGEPLTSVTLDFLGQVINTPKNITLSDRDKKVMDCLSESLGKSESDWRSEAYKLDGFKKPHLAMESKAKTFKRTLDKLVNKDYVVEKDGYFFKSPYP